MSRMNGAFGVGLMALLLTSPARAAEFYVTVAGLVGEPDYEQRFTTAAKDLDRVLKATGADVHVQTLVGGDATRARLTWVLEQVAREAKADDDFVLTLIGHGSYDGVGVVESLMEEAAPPNAVQRGSAGPRHGRTELVVRVLIQLEAPVAFGAQIGIGRQRERLIAGLRFRTMTVTPQSRAVGGRSGGNRHAGPREEHRHDDHDRSASPHTHKGALTYRASPAREPVRRGASSAAAHSRSGSSRLSGI